VREPKRWVTVALLACLAAVLVLSYALAPRGGEFEGTDAAATAMLEDAGVRPWFEPLFAPGSAEVESGLFALQAALGAGVLGFALGNLRGRRVSTGSTGGGSTGGGSTGVPGVSTGSTDG